MNKRIKENHLFDSAIPMSLAGSINQLWTVACLPANFKGPLVQSWPKQQSKYLDQISKIRRSRTILDLLQPFVS